MNLAKNFLSDTPFRPNKQLFREIEKPTKWYKDEDLERAKALLDEMTTEQKIAQLHQVNGDEGYISDELCKLVKEGLGSVINEVDPETVKKLQYIAINETEHGIPLLIGRDVIHGFNTIFPIPLALAATWDLELIEKTARYAAIEASQVGINWTFSPMIDVCRDGRWGRVAESSGEDPLINSLVATAMVNGYQNYELSQDTSIAACAKHFAGYGASEAGKDYNTTNLSHHDLYNVFLPPFLSAVNTGSATIMTSFSDTNGIPVSGNRWLLTDVLREQWQFEGFVISDWGSVEQLVTHGLANDRKHAAYLGLEAGVDMEMVSGTFYDHGKALIQEEHILEDQINVAALRILTVKFALGLFDNKEQLTKTPIPIPDNQRQAILDCAKEAATKSCVLLKNRHQCLPLDSDQKQKIALIGFLADDPYEMLGTWIFDGDVKRSITLKQALEQASMEANYSLTYHPAFVDSRSQETHLFEDAISVCKSADTVILCIGEESILSGEAHCRVNTGLPGVQQAFLDRLAALDKNVICVVMAGRPLLLSNVLPKVNALLYAWHPGSMGGPAIVDLLFGVASPSGRLPISFLREQGQVPNYYAHKNTGRPVNNANYIYLTEFPARAPQTSLGMASLHIDCHFTPLFPFGFGLSYSSLHYSSTEVSADTIGLNDSLYVSVVITNRGERDITETVQLYLRDLTASVTRPVKELRQFKKAEIAPQSSTKVEFEITVNDLGFYNDHGERIVESGEFELWVGPDAQSTDKKSFALHL